LDINIALDCIRIGTDGVGALDKLCGHFLVNAGDSHGERSGQHERTRGVSPPNTSGSATAAGDGRDSENQKYRCGTTCPLSSVTPLRSKPARIIAAYQIAPELRQPELICG
jgi:hypothetical protein